MLPDRLNFRSASTLMVQGCTSDAGKSVMVAGLCRLLKRRGIEVAPFKPQNMALNSAVTSDGGEIGRAQAVQAIAAGVPPHTDMNPVLLKPASDTGAQVIVHGQVVDAMQAQQFHDYKKVAMAAVMESHQRLHEQYQYIVVEGAGSPAEINLREGDIANMGFAENADCPVILIADIDRGGVFAHLVGTLDVLAASEQNRIVGFLINKFRGDIALLEPGLDWLEERTGKPVIGVLPYLADFHLDAEDAILETQNLSAEQALKVVVPVLPRISNHTDFDALRLHPGVDLKFVSANQPCPAADLIILPGSKNVIEDLQTLLAAGWQTDLQRHLRYGGKVLGVCGGFQMLGKSISDPTAIESNQEKATGFGLLDVLTVLHPQKKLLNTEGKICAPGLPAVPIAGYEIHCGETTATAPSIAPFAKLSADAGASLRVDGAVSNDQQVIGTYVHGLFDQPAACAALLQWAGLQNDGGRIAPIEEVREQELERLADMLEQQLKPEFLHWLLGYQQDQEQTA